jgi:surface antigen
MKTNLCLAILSLVIPCITLAETPTLCEEQTSTIHYIDKQGRELVKTVTEKTCVDNSHNLKRAGLAAGICGIPSVVNPNIEHQVVSCMKPDESWEQFNIATHIDQTSVDRNQDIPLPEFYDYGKGDTTGIIFGSLVGGFYSLSPIEKEAHTEAVATALDQAQLAQRVVWRLGKTHGYAMPVATFPSSQGYCRRIHIFISSSGRERAMSKTACYENATGKWRWISDKY